MKSLTFSDQDRDEQGFIKLPESPVSAPAASSPVRRPVAPTRRLSPQQQRERRHQLALVATLALVPIVLLALFRLTGQTQPMPTSAPMTRPTAPAPQPSVPPAQPAGHIVERAIIARWSYADPGNVTALPPGQAIDHVIGHADRGTWLFVSLDVGEQTTLWVQASDVPQLAASGPDMTIRPTPIPAPVQAVAPAAPVQAVAPAAPVCTDANVRELGFSAGWLVSYKNTLLGTVEAWSCTSAEDARQQASQAEQAMIAAYEQAQHPTAVPRRSE